MVCKFTILIYAYYYKLFALIILSFCLCLSPSAYLRAPIIYSKIRQLRHLGISAVIKFRVLKIIYNHTNFINIIRRIIQINVIYLQNDKLGKQKQEINKWQKMDNSIVSMDESKQLIQYFFKVRFSIPKLLQKRITNHKQNTIVQHIKKKFTQMILDIEKQLMLAEKIKTMQLHEYRTEQMFTQLMKLQQFLTKEQLINDFKMYYRNRVSRVTVYQTDLIPSENRLNIYNAFIEYAIDQDLFRFRIPDSGYDHKLQYLEDPMTIYTTQALVMLYNLYVSQNGNLQVIQKKIRKEGKYKTIKYEGEQLKHNIKNLHLIGLYRMYKSAMRKSMHPCNGWQTFSAKYLPSLDKLTLDWLKVLFRIAVYDDANNQQTFEISKLMRRKLNDFKSLAAEKRKEKKEKERHQQFLARLEIEMRKIINGEQ